jgi:protease-4
MAADEIYANRNCWTGSIGVIISIMNYEGLMEKIGVSEIDITSGKNKTIGSGAHKMTEQQEKILQGLVNEAYEQFTGIVADGRDMNIEKVKKLADGRIYSAAQAKKYGLVDDVLGFNEAKSKISNALGNGDINYYVPKRNNTIQYYFGQFLGMADILGKKSDIQAAKELIDNDESGVLMYYAK